MQPNIALFLTRMDYLISARGERRSKKKEEVRSKATTGGLLSQPFVRIRHHRHKVNKNQENVPAGQRHRLVPRATRVSYFGRADDGETSGKAHNSTTTISVTDQYCQFVSLMGFKDDFSRLFCGIIKHKTNSAL